MSLALMAARGTHDRPGGWTPKNLGTLSLWLDADDATTITVSTGVSQWNDKSGNGRNVSQSTGANQPAYVTGARNGRAVLRFDGAAHCLSGGDVLDLGTASLSVAAAFVPDSVANLGIITKRRTDAGLAGYWDIAPLRVQHRQSTTTVRSATSSGSAGSATVGAWAIDRTNGLTAWFNGTAGTPTTTGYPDSTNYNHAEPLIVGANKTATAFSAYYDGDICEIVASLAAWSTADRQKVEGYLAHKWGTTASLPSGHPYRSIAP